jgi:hypothetical protein
MDGCISAAVNLPSSPTLSHTPHPHLTALSHPPTPPHPPAPLKVYCLPDNYEVVDRSIDDIRAVLNPAFTKEQVGDGWTDGRMDG